MFRKCLKIYLFIIHFNYFKCYEMTDTSLEFCLIVIHILISVSVFRLMYR